MEVQIKIDIQDTNGHTKKRLTVAVPEDITQAELVRGLSENYSSLFGDGRVSVFVDWPSNLQATGKFVVDGANVIIRPRSSGMRIISEE
jgi:hypothetical protein